MMDNVARERQQYAGDVDHAKFASYLAFGEYRQPRRMLHTFAAGQGREGWFLDCYPGWDRCTRLWQKYLDLTGWGPLVDHAMGFVMHVAWYHLFSGEMETVRALYPKVLRFDRWLRSQVGADGLLPVSGYAWNDVWMDHFGWKVQADKAAALNIYYVGYLREGVARLAELMGKPAVAAEARARAARMVELVRRRFWSARERLIVDNLPRLAEDGELRLHDRTLAMALLYGVIPAGEERAALDLLAGLPVEQSLEEYPLPGRKGQIGASFTANTCWRYWALSRFGRAAAVVRDLEQRWGRMESLKENKTFSEWWYPGPSSVGGVWAQNTQVPIFILYGEVLGVQPRRAAFAEFDVRPQLGGLEHVEGTVWAPAGGIHVRCHSLGHGALEVHVESPAGLKGWLVVREGLPVQGATGAPLPYDAPGWSRWPLPAGRTVRIG
jgi:hypothetical protein